MSNTKEDGTTAVFCTALTVEALLGVYRYYDVYRYGLGGPETKHNAWVDMRQRGVSALLYGAAAAWAIADYSFLGGDGGEGQREEEKGNNDEVHANHGPILMA
jgi:hypothetical protein